MGTTARGVAVRLAAIPKEIDKSFRDPDIGPRSVAAAVNVSARYLHQLLEERGMVFSKYVLECRQERALAVLNDAHNDHLRVGQIAYDCSFNGLSYFNRRFRARHGETPGAARAAGGYH